jgi:hypothetical protein
LLTFYTTPVIYIFFDRLAERIRGRHLKKIPLAVDPQPGAESA